MRLPTGALLSFSRCLKYGIGSIYSPVSVRRRLQVQVRSGRSPFITAQGNDVSLLHRELSGLEFQVAHKRFMRILILTYASLYVFCKGNHMSIYRSQSVGMRHVNDLSVSSVQHCHARHMAVGNAVNRFPVTPCVLMSSPL